MTAHSLMLSSLPPGCILNIMSQLPPLSRMQLASSCSSFQQIYKHGRLYSCVEGSCGEAVPSHLQSLDGCFSTLSAAVKNSRPGGVIVIGPGDHVAADIVIPHPLRIVGRSSELSSVLLCSSAGATASLQFCASGEVANLAIRSTRAACISGQGGSSLWVRHCSLECDARGLSHLYSAIITARPDFRARQQPTQSAAAVMGQGGIHVFETVVQGGIRVAGLQRVRCIAHGNRHSLWFDIYHHTPAELKHLLPTTANGTVRAPKRRAKRKALEIDEAAAEALLDKRASSWASQYARAPL